MRNNVARFSRGALVAVGVLAITIAFVAVAEVEEGHQAYTETIDVRILNLDVVVTDRDGQRVEGLGPKDFTIVIDGEPVSVDYFSEIRSGSFVDPSGPVPGGAAGKKVSTSALLFIDEFFSISRDKNTVLRSLRERVTSLDPEDSIAIVAWDGKTLDVITDWSNDVATIQKGLDEAIDRPGLGLHRSQERRQYDVTLDRENMFYGSGRYDRDRHHLGTQERQYADLLVHQLQGTIGAATASMINMNAPEGRKALMMLAGGWPMNIVDWVGRSSERIIFERGYPNGAELYSPIHDAANLLGFTVYGIDVPGLMQTAGGDASHATPDPGAMGMNTFMLEDELHSSLRYIANETGGLALINGQRIGALDEVRGDFESYYWLGFTPQWAGDDEARTIEVAVANPEYFVRTRQSYFDISPKTQISYAMSSALLYGPFEESADLNIEIGEPRKAKKGNLDVPVKITVPAGKLTSYETEDGWVTEMIVFMAALDKSGGRADVPGQPRGFLSTVKPPEGQPVTHSATLRLAKKTVRLTVGVYDPIGGNVLLGTVTKDD